MHRAQSSASAHLHQRNERTSATRPRLLAWDRLNQEVPRYHRLYYPEQGQTNRPASDAAERNWRAGLFCRCRKPRTLSLLNIQAPEESDEFFSRQAVEQTIGR